jgi:hypothetical protein
MPRLIKGVLGLLFGLVLVVLLLPIATSTLAGDNSLWTSVTDVKECEDGCKADKKICESDCKDDCKTAGGDTKACETDCKTTCKEIEEACKIECREPATEEAP